jgi:hypothetical protein
MASAKTQDEARMEIGHEEMTDQMYFNGELRCWFHRHPMGGPYTPSGGGGYLIGHDKEKNVLFCNRCKWTTPLFNCWIVTKRIIEVRRIRIDLKSNW